jgi:hypothetical protein
MVRPVQVLPVNEMTRARMCVERALPEIWPWPERMMMTPGGKRHSAIHCETFHHCFWSVFDDPSSKRYIQSMVPSRYSVGVEIAIDWTAHRYRVEGG